MKKSAIRKAVIEVIEELSTTSGAGGYMTPFAFSKNGKKNKATKQAEKLGYTTVKLKKRPHNTKMFDYLDENNTRKI
jgi:hypothetical protein|tara:strand:+ start:185 stop:415 length:231 start_codon:yes stop_codon:yes gene_type:complete